MVQSAFKDRPTNVADEVSSRFSRGKFRTRYLVHYELSMYSRHAFHFLCTQKKRGRVKHVLALDLMRKSQRRLLAFGNLNCHFLLDFLRNRLRSSSNFHADILIQLRFRQSPFVSIKVEQEC